MSKLITKHKKEFTIFKLITKQTKEFMLLIAEREKEFKMFKLSSFLFLISVFLFGTSCESIKKKTQNSTAPASRSLAGFNKPSVGISGTQLNQLKRRERDILSRIKREKGSLKVAYSFLVNEKTGRICYVESFKTRDIVPRFAQPASYEEARLFQKPAHPKCSGQEYSMISSYQNASLLADDGKGGVQVAGGAGLAVIGLGAMAVCAFGGDIIMDHIDSSTDKIAGIDTDSPATASATELTKQLLHFGVTSAGMLMVIGGSSGTVTRLLTTAPGLAISPPSPFFIAIMGCGLGIAGTYMYHAIVTGKR